MEEAMGAGRYSFVAVYASGAYDADRGLEFSITRDCTDDV